MTDLLEVMKEDHDILVDKVGEMTRRNDHLQNLANDKESQFEILKNAADEAQDILRAQTLQFNDMKYQRDKIEQDLLISNDKLASETLVREDVSSKEEMLKTENVQLQQNYDHFKTAYHDLDNRKGSEVEMLSKEIDDAVL